MKNNTSIELFVIQKVKEKRETAKLSQNELNDLAGFCSGYVNHCESLNYIRKYNLNHLNELAKVFNCPISDFFPEKFLEANCLQEYKEIQEEKKKLRKKRESPKKTK